MKKLTAILLITVLMMTFLTGCGKKRELYNNVNLADYVEVGDYLGIEVDTQSAEFDSAYQGIIDLDIEDNELYNVITSEGAVADGDIVNLDYEGKIDGVAFSGGTAQGYDLTIGSGTFIDDFEEELIGAAIGETRDVTAKFPENYGNESVNGKEAVFTCKINYIKRPMTVEESYEKMDFDSVDAYCDDIEERAIKSYILNTVCEASRISDYPQEDSEKLNEAIYEAYVELFKTRHNVSLEEVLVANGTTVEQYKLQIKNQMVPSIMNTSMVMYYILDSEKLEIYESTVESQEIDQPIMAESYAVQDIVLEYLLDNAVIK